MSLHPLHSVTEFISRPIIGATASLGSVVVSLLPHLESGLRLSTLFAGFCIAMLALRKAWRDRHK
jgi:uncharacterized membrane protein YjjB (DUF3815 family)